ncbi:hypothetical protein NOR_04263 [Metarhizium rileyi]|uniref:Uncharacterized protein n=1 Tax=Metarhizium rileyi (strain RCEF 4871) TaxID=1649241 RepID=A0A162JFR5_METRR|nr:hypothetical protein NOR_04263 [Metarhizium rileyi RCEF 4871]
MASLLAVLSLLPPITVSASIGKSGALQSRQVSGSLQWFKPGLNCIERTEYCLGTIAWCSNPEYYSQLGGYKDQDSCFNARLGKTAWRYMNTDCLATFEQCEGTDVICSRVENPGVRSLCYESHTKGKWLQPFSPGCLAPVKDDDERCVGTQAYCEAKERIESYGSTQYCLDNREDASSNPDAVKQSFFPSNYFRCFGDPTEECIGTEAFCARVPTKDREECLQARENPPFYIELSPDCGTSSDKGSVSEACIGTENWCQSTEVYKLYGSVEKCRDYRRRASGPGKWFPPKHACSFALQMSEQCQGTEEMCQYHSPDRDSCFKARGLGPFLLANSSGCSSTGQQGEDCLGTDSWCHEMYSQNNYLDEGECFSRRGFNQKKLSAEVAKVVMAIAKQAVLKYGENVTQHAVYYDLVGQRGDETTAMKAVKTYLDGYLAKLQNDIPEITKRFMSRVQRKALAA